MNAGFWFTVGVLTGATATAASVPWWRGLGAMLTGRRRNYAMVGAGLAVFALSAALLYLAIDSRATSSTRVAVAPGHLVGSESASGPGAKAISMQDATTRLEARLEKDGGSAEDWELLAKSYEFLGRTADAERARQHRASVSTTTQSTGSPNEASMPSPSDLASQAQMLSSKLPTATAQPAAAATRGATATVNAAPPSELERQLKLNPQDKRAWLGLAQWHHDQHDLGAARTAYEKLISLHGMTAQSWADYADVAGTLAGGSLRGEAGHAIDESLALDSANPKALWLAATRALEEKRYDEALGLWTRLRGLLPADSPDARMVDSNIAEARQLLQTDSAAGTAPSASSSTPDGISGTVSIEGQLASRVDRGATLFIYAKAADSPGPPLAVLRVSAGNWPVSFHLDDSMAMLPSRRLSQFQKVIVEARISRSGQAAPAAGDLYVTSGTVSPSSGKKLALVINHEIG
jgi:cytochrome c-type biogenesis protein CcmH/NrfG